jgi:DNA repair protein RadC
MAPRPTTARKTAPKRTRSPLGCRAIGNLPAGRVKGKTAVTLAQDLLGYFGSLPRLLNSTHNEITRCHGMGISKWAQIQAAYELVKRSLEQELMRDTILGSPVQMRELIQAQIALLPYEVFLCLHLDSQNRLIECQELFRGSVTQTPFTPENSSRRLCRATPAP